jgi:hypothetical protein
MTLLRRALIPVVLIIAAVGIVGPTSSASPATATTYSYTVAGTDAHSLDPHIQPMFVEGGGVEGLQENSADQVLFPYLEVTLDLPVGAKVTSFAVTYSYCKDDAFAPTIVFGSYEPATGNTVQNATIVGTECGLATTTKKVKPSTTIVAGRRYAIDYRVSFFAPYPGQQASVFYGATIKYTCSSPCVP